MDVLIVGGGLAGLSCALKLHQAGVPFVLADAADRLGGRVRTDEVDGFLLDRGFQVLLTAYPECRRVLDYRALQLGSFHPGAMVRAGGRFHTVADPIREPARAIETATSPVGSAADKLRMGKLWARTMAGSAEDLFERSETSTIQALKEAGFSGSMVERFFRPFLGGIFLERDLVTSSRKLEFVFRMFALGSASLPARGMQSIPEQMASKLPSASIRTGVTVVSLNDGRAITATGEELTADRIVVATEQPAAARLLGNAVNAPFTSTTCVYFEAPEPPVDGPWLVLNGEGRGPVNNLCVPTEVCPAYSATGRALVSVTVIGNMPDPEAGVRQQLTEWFGRVVGSWRHIRTYRIPYAQPLQTSVAPGMTPVSVADHVFVGGDYLDVAGQHGAIASGRRAAEAIIG